MMKTIKLLLIAGISFSAGLLVMWLYALSTLGAHRGKPPENMERISEISSSDGRFVAAIVAPRLDGLGATVSQPYQLWITSADGESRLMLEADKTNGLKVNWRSPLHLEVCYSEAQIVQFRNRFFSISTSAGLPSGRTLEVTLRKVSEDSDCQR